MCDKTSTTTYVNANPNNLLKIFINILSNSLPSSNCIILTGIYAVKTKKYKEFLPIYFKHFTTHKFNMDIFSETPFTNIIPAIAATNVIKRLLYTAPLISILVPYKIKLI